MRTRLSVLLPTYFIVLIILGLALFPLYWMLVTATTKDSAMFSREGQFLPGWQNLAIFPSVMGGQSVHIWLTNSLIVAVGTALLSLVLAVHMAYAMSRFRFAGKGAVTVGLFITQMLPEALLVVPLFAIFSGLGVLNTYAPLILGNVAFTLPILSMILKTAIDNIPIELDEAARIDGCSRFIVLWRVVLPLAAPSLAAAGVIGFFNGWNEYVFAQTFVSSEGMRTASVGLASFIGELATPIQAVMAVGFMYTLPAVVFYLLLQRYIVEGMTAGSVKG